MEKTSEYDFIYLCNFPEKFTRYWTLTVPGSVWKNISSFSAKGAIMTFYMMAAVAFNELIFLWIMHRSEKKITGIFLIEAIYH